MNCLQKSRGWDLLSKRSAIRNLATVSLAAPAARNHKIVVVGNGSAGVAVSHQLLRKGKFTKDDIAVIDPAKWHHYQPGWTLVGGGLKDKKALRTPMDDLVDGKLKFYNKSVASFSPNNNLLTLDSGDTIHYGHLVVAPGIKIDYDSINGLSEALSNPHSPVASIYSYDYCDKVFRNIQRLKSGSAVFTQPAGVIKCAGAPQKIMWLALDHWGRSGLYQNDPKKSSINVTFATGLPSMFGVPKYSSTLDALRKERAVEGLFEHDLISISGNTATFARANSQAKVHRRFDFLHVAPKNAPHDFIKVSPLSNETGYVDVDPHSLRHRKYPNIWSLGDAANLPTSKTVAAITSQAVVVTQNVLRSLEGKDASEEYDGYTSCPLLTGDKKVFLAEFKYGGVPKETFKSWVGIDQAVPRRAFYHLKKDFFPWVYDRFHVKGRWGGPKGWIW